MNRLYSKILIFIALLSTVAAQAEDSPLSKLAWRVGPAEGTLGNRAKIKVPKGYAFLDAADTKKFMEMNHNLSGGNEYLFVPSDFSWFAVFNFSTVGYVKDDESIDSGALLESVKKGTEQGNEERRKRGWSTMSILGWRFQPQYDKQLKLLEWAFLAKDDKTNSQIINYNTRLLGRNGVMEVVLVSNPEKLDEAVAAFKKTLSDYEFVQGEKYAEFRDGDHVAEFGLAALIAGGAAAVATKKGFWAVLAGFFAAAWKFIAVTVAGVFAWLRSLFKKKS